MTRTIDVAARIDAAPIGTFQVRTVMLCGAVTLLDGFDVQAVALAAPAAAQGLGVPVSALGPVIAASLGGVMIGTIAAGRLGDRYGRRPIILAAFLLLGLSSLASAMAGSIPTFAIARFLTGLAIGGCLPNVTALCAEYMPERRVGLAVTVMYAGVPMGGVIGGLIAGPMLAVWGWRSLFVVGGLLPLILLVPIALWLPESVRFLALRRGDDALAILARIDRGFRLEPDDRPATPDAQVAYARFATLLAPALRRTTLLLWALFFLAMAGMYLLLSWLPTAFALAGWSPAAAPRMVALFQIGGIGGGLLGGWLIDRIGAARLLATWILLGVAGIVALPAAFDAPVAAGVLAVIAGLGFLGTTLCITALSASVYPTAVRATGVGWALGVGRLGAVASPLAGGWLLAAGASPATLLRVAAVPALLALFAALALRTETDR